MSLIIVVAHTHTLTLTHAAAAKLFPVRATPISTMVATGTLWPPPLGVT